MATKFTQKEFVDKSNKVHNDVYDYSKVFYKNTDTKVIIICKIHGEFTQTPHNHLRNRGCPKCANNVLLTTSQFVERATNIHRNIYDYSLVEYVDWKTDVLIICPIHGLFKQRPNNHLSGKQGCPNCKVVSKGEKAIQDFLDSKNISYIKNHKFLDCKSIRQLPFDFYIDSLNLCVEYDGIQHYRGWRRSLENLKEITRRDLIKTKYCLDNDIKLIRIKYTEYKNIESILSLNLESVSPITHADSVTQGDKS